MNILKCLLTQAELEKPAPRVATDIYVSIDNGIVSVKNNLLDLFTLF